MRPIPPLVLFGMMFGPVRADSITPYIWQARPIVVFAPDADDPRLVTQLDRLKAAQGALVERDCVVIVDVEPGSALRQRFAPGDFALILVCKNGAEVFRSDTPVNPDVLGALIDSQPLRATEFDH